MVIELQFHKGMLKYFTIVAAKRYSFYKVTAGGNGGEVSAKLCKGGMGMGVRVKNRGWGRRGHYFFSCFFFHRGFVFPIVKTPSELCRSLYTVP